MNKQHTGAHAYLLRLWPTGAAGLPVWRASLENIQTSERLGFATLEQLFVFLMQQAEQGGEAPNMQAQSEPPDTYGQASKGARS